MNRDYLKKTHISIKTLTKQIRGRQTDTLLQGRASDTRALRLTGEKYIPHDLYRTAATLMGILKVLPHVIEKCLNHMEENRIIRPYQHASLMEERDDAFNKLGMKLAALSGLSNI